MTITFKDRVAIVTGAAAGLGRSHAMELACRGAKVVVNDFGGAVDGTGGSSEPAEKVVEEIKAAGGEAISHGADVTNSAQVADMVAKTMEAWGRVDILINNAGILRDASFMKMELADFEKVVHVHLMGSVVCSKAVWPMMREQSYGRILMTTSSSGLYGNFGQSNYGAAKMGLIGLMNVLHLEGEKYNVRVNALGPAAATRMTDGILTPEVAEMMTPESVTPAAIFLVGEDAPSRVILNATAGGYSRTYIAESKGIAFTAEDQTAENIAQNWETISDLSTTEPLPQGGAQVMKFAQMAAALKG